MACINTLRCSDIFDPQTKWAHDLIQFDDPQSDLENVKAANKDIEDLREIKNKLLSYATTLNKVEKTEEAMLASSSYHFRPSSYLAIIVIFTILKIMN